MASVTPPLPLQAERESLARKLGREVKSRIMRLPIATVKGL
jgi:hypothetical protein